MAEPTAFVVGTDSDEDGETDRELESSESEEEEEQLEATALGTTQQQAEPAGDYWTAGTFSPTGPTPAEKFTDHFRSTCRSGVMRTGLQVPLAHANSVVKAWRLVFTSSILEMIVKHTNAYGETMKKDWTPIDKRDLTDWISVLFAMSIQKRKDKPSNWFSSNPLLESKIAKAIMSGRKFATLLRFLHVCDPTETRL
jgi:hypothetical protein